MARLHVCNLFLIFYQKKNESANNSAFLWKKQFVCIGKYKFYSDLFYMNFWINLQSEM